MSHNIGLLSSLPQATPNNLPKNGFDIILYHSAYLTTPNPWECVRRRWKETEKLTTTHIKICNKLCSTSVVHPVAIPNRIPAEPYYCSPEQFSFIALLSYLYSQTWPPLLQEGMLPAQPPVLQHKLPFLSSQFFNIFFFFFLFRSRDFWNLIFFGLCYKLCICKQMLFVSKNKC